MDQSTETWVNERLGKLATAFDGEPGGWPLFEPTASFYDALAGGEDAELARATATVARHSGLVVVPEVRYEFGMRMPDGSAGQIRQRFGEISEIRIPLAYVGKPYALGGILAHEMTHEFLLTRRFPTGDEEQTERLTDLAAFYLGLGKIMLNGIVVEDAPGAPTATVLGYLPPELKVYAYEYVCRRLGIREADARRGLTEQARGFMQKHPAQLGPLL